MGILRDVWIRICPVEDPLHDGVGKISLVLFDAVHQYLQMVGQPYVIMVQIGDVFAPGTT